MSGHTQTIRNGQSLRLNIMPGESVAVVAVSGTYNASIVQGAGIGAIATAATGATYGPYATGIVILLTASAASEIDFAIAVTPVITSDSNSLDVINPTTGTRTRNIGASAATLVGFHGVAATAQASAYTQTYATASKTHANLTSTAIAAVAPAAAPAGGVGAAAGAYDTAANRDAAIVTINDLRTMAIELKLDHDALLVDVTNLKQVVNALIDDLQAKGLAA